MWAWRGPYPGRADVFLATGLDHGFKFSVLFGRILADLAEHGRTDHPIGRFGVDRFASAVAV
jgi:sarcosine oxidase